jgi:hypothetical protein
MLQIMTFGILHAQLEKRSLDQKIAAFGSSYAKSRRTCTPDKFAFETFAKECIHPKDIFL